MGFINKHILSIFKTPHTGCHPQKRLRKVKSYTLVQKENFEKPLLQHIGDSYVSDEIGVVNRVENNEKLLKGVPKTPRVEI